MNQKMQDLTKDRPDIPLSDAAAMDRLCDFAEWATTPDLCECGNLRVLAASVDLLISAIVQPQDKKASDLLSASLMSLAEISLHLHGPNSAATEGGCKDE